MSDFDAVDFFRSRDFVEDPYPYFEHLRSQCPVQREPHHDVVMVTGYEEALAVYHDVATWSSCNSVTGPFPGFPVPLEGDDVTDLIVEHRDALPMSDQLPTMDPPAHKEHRGLLMRLLTPKRLKENEASMWDLADRQLDGFVERGGCELVRDFAAPFTLLVIADLLGIPEADRPRFRDVLQGAHRPKEGLGSTGDDTLSHSPLEFLYGELTSYVEDRRRSPQADVLTGLAIATFPDGSTPEILDVVRVAANLFGAGQETTVRLLSSALWFLAEDPELQQRLRDQRDLIPNFIEEVLRVESPVKGDFRLSRVPTTVGGVDLPAGTTVMVVNAAANRDPRRFECPADFRVDRPNAREHVAFGHGAHFCPGAPLARAEGRVALERVLDRMHDIRISEAHHGPPGARRFAYAPTYILRGLNQLHLDFTPAP
ncbi:MAG: cytochrome [Actinomycetia bacterium]|nr:cytochrome [Actinomycetes bacterium]